MKRYHNVDRIERISSEVSITTRRLSQNKRNQKSKKQMKFGITIPNSVRDAIILDTQNKNTL